MIYKEWYVLGMIGVGPGRGPGGGGAEECILRLWR